jgi:hypothetical protein
VGFISGYSEYPLEVIVSCGPFSIGSNIPWGSEVTYANYGLVVLDYAFVFTCRLD